MILSMLTAMAREDTTADKDIFRFEWTDIQNLIIRGVDRLWGEYGFYDAFSPTADWVASSYLVR